MTRGLTPRKLEQDRQMLMELIEKMRTEIAQLNAQVLRLDGALNYVNDNIKKGGSDARKRID
jgi:prefoldin subunit 5